MEIRAGYKHTELGVIPEDWEVMCLDEIVKSFQLGGNYPNNEIDGGNALIKMANLGRGNIELKKEYFISSEITPSENDRAFYGDIFFNTRNTLDLVGKVAIWRDEIPKAYFNSNIMRIVFKEEKISSNFCMNLILNTRNSIYQLRGIATGTTSVAAIYTRDLVKLLVPVPPKSEQTAIATALSDADALISSLEKLIAKKRNIKQGAMQKLLQPKEGWEHKTLGEIGEITGGGVDKLINEDEVPVRLVNYMDVFRRDLIYSDELTHWVTAPQSKIQKCAVKQGDIFFTPSSEMRFDIAVSAIAMENIPDAAYSYHLVRLRLFEDWDWDLHFRAYIFKTKYFLSQAEKFCEGSGKRYVITLPKFRSLKIYFPVSKDEQNAISTILFDMNAEIEALEIKLEKYRKVKLGMMQNLLTGKIRI